MPIRRTVVALALLAATLLLAGCTAPTDSNPTELEPIPSSVAPSSALPTPTEPPTAAPTVIPPAVQSTSRTPPLVAPSAIASPVRPAVIDTPQIQNEGCVDCSSIVEPPPPPPPSAVDSRGFPLGTTCTEFSCTSPGGLIFANPDAVPSPRSNGIDLCDLTYCAPPGFDIVPGPPMPSTGSSGGPGLR